MNSAILTRLVFSCFWPVRRIDFVFCTYSTTGFTELRWWARWWDTKPVLDLHVFSHWLHGNDYYSSMTGLTDLRWWARRWETKPVLDLQTLSHWSQMNWVVDWFIVYWYMSLNRNIKLVISWYRLTHSITLLIVVKNDFWIIRRFRDSTINGNEMITVKQNLSWMK
jgi:hypothetical protein